MIDYKSLRIGNKFQFGSIVQTVFEIVDNTDRGRIKQDGYEVLIVPEENRNQYKPIEITGIPLTEEWLLKFGFEKSNKMIFTGSDGFSKRDIDFYIGFTKHEDGWLFHNPHFNLTIQYVHQLQNLYFCLTGTELTALQNRN